MRLLDQDAQLLDEGAFLNRIVVMNFMFTSCPIVCPRLTRALGEARDLLPGSLKTRVQFLSVSVDPEHDEPAQLKDFARRHRADLPEWRFARIESEELAELSRRLSVFEPGSAPDPSAHSMAVHLFDPSGRPLQRYDGGTIDPKRLAREITALAALEQSPKP